MTTLYFDCFSGISGDMVIGALLNAGADFVQMEEELKKLKIADEYSLSIRHVNKNGSSPDMSAECLAVLWISSLKQE